MLYSKSVVSLPPSLDNPVSKHTQFPETKRERERERVPSCCQWCCNNSRECLIQKAKAQTGSRCIVLFFL